MANWKFWNREVSSAPVEQKLNPAQEDIVNIYGAGDLVSKEIPSTYTAYYEYLEVVNRAVNMVVDDVSEIPLTVGDTIAGMTPIIRGVRAKTVFRLLNKEPNPYQDMSSFKRNLLIDFVLDGNMFIYFDGVSLYHLPANYVSIEADSATYVKGYKFQGTKSFTPDEIIHIKDNSFYSIYRGTSRLRPARRTMALLANMRQFQDNFFSNGAVPGLVITSPNTLSDKIKERMIQSWMQRYRPNAGGRRPVVLDGGLAVDTITDISFREMAFEESIESAEKEILKVLGVPPIMLDSGNNANIRPNHRLYYLETIIPIVRKMNFAFERYFGYEITEDITNIAALQPEMSEQGQYYQALVNGGVITPNEARDNLGYPPVTGGDELRIPANIAGSAADPSQGGRPPSGGKE